MDVDLIWESLKLFAEIKILIPPVNNKRCKFASALSIIKRNLRVEQHIFSAVFQLPMEGFSCKVTPHTLHVLQMEHICF